MSIVYYIFIIEFAKTSVEKFKIFFLIELCNLSAVVFCKAIYHVE